MLHRYQGFQFFSKVIAKVNTKLLFDHGISQIEMTNQLGNHGAAQFVVVIQFDAFEYRQLSLPDQLFVLVQLFDILDISIAYPADGRNAQADQIAVRMRGIALEVTVQMA